MEGDAAGAEQLYREAVAIHDKKLAPCHSWRVSAEIGLLRMLKNQGKLDEMERLLTEFYADVEASHPDELCRVDYYKSFLRLYEAKHKIAPDQGFDRKADADLLEKAVNGVLEKQIRTGDIAESGAKVVSTSGMGDAVLAELNSLV